VLRDAFERLVEARPTNAFAWSALAHLYCHEHGFWFNARPDPLDRARKALGRALELDAVDQHGWEALALAYFFERDAEGFAHASERAIALNPRNANTLAWIGVETVHAGDLDRGCALVERAMTLNPDHPGWYHIAMCNRHLVRGEHAEALRAAKRINMPQHIGAHLSIAIAAGELGRATEAASAVEAIERLAPVMADPAVVAEFTRRFKWDEAVADQMAAGYQKAVALREGSSGRSRPPSSGAAASTAGRWAISVTLFGASGGDGAVALAAGLTEDIATGLSRFGNLKVLARHARYVLEGSVRQSGTALRVTARVVETVTGANIWADTYERTTAPGAFVLQDDLASRIVSTVADPTGVLATAMAAEIGDRAYGRLSVQELVIRFHVYTGQLRVAEHARLRDAFEHALERESNAAEGWACLAHLYGQEHALGLNPQPESRERERRAAERAVELDPQSPWAWTALARSHMFGRDGAAMRAAIERALALNPLNADMLAHCSIFLSSCGEFDRALAVVTRAMELKAHHQGWFYFPIFNAHYVRGEDEAALDAAKKINMPALPLASMSAAAAAGQLGRPAEARASLHTLRQRAPQLLEPAAARAEWSVWLWSDALLDRLVDGLEKALALTAADAEQRPQDPNERPVSDAAAPARSVASSTSGTPALLTPANAAGRSPLEDLSLAVRPFTARGGDATAVALAEALSDDVTTGLSRFEHLRVMAPAAAQKTAGAGAATWRYVLEGTARTSGKAVRVGVRLSDAHTGANVWAENFDLDGDSDVFTQQDDLASRIVATVGDPTGALAKAMRAALSDTPIEELSVEGLMVLYHAYTEHLRPDDHARLRQALEQFVQRQPRSHLGWAILSRLYEHEHSHHLNMHPDATARQWNAAHRALELDSSSQNVWVSVASAHKFTGDMPALHGAVERAVAINPLNADALAFCALLISTGGADERALQLARVAMHHKPRHPGWYHFPTFNALYMQGQDEAALAEARLINMPRLALMYLSSAAAAGQLGRAVDARLAVDALSAIDASLLDPARAKAAWGVWNAGGPLLDRLVDGFGKALALTSAGTTAGSMVPGAARTLQSSAPERPQSGSTPSATVRSDPGMRVAVLPFGHRGSDTAAALAHGLAEDITTGLSRFAHLRVVPADTAATLTPENAASAGVRYLLEGRLQSAGDVLRVTVRLIDGATGANLWADSFDRRVETSLFSIQDEIASHVVATIGDTSGVLARSMAAALMERPVEELTVRELVLRFHAYVEHLQADEHGRLRSGFERALEREPLVAEGWACLSDLYEHEHSQARNPLPDSLGRQRRAAERAVEIDPRSQRGWTAMAAVHTFARDLTALRAAVERAVSLNPLDADTVGLCALYLGAAGEDGRAIELFEKAAALKPHHPGWYHWPPFIALYRRRHFADALAQAKRITMPQLPTTHLAAAAAAARVGAPLEARTALDSLERLDAKFLGPDAARAAWRLWLWDETLVEDLVEGLGQAVELTRASSRDAQLTSPRVNPDAASARPSSDASGTALSRGASLLVAVQPFAARADDVDASELARGLTDDVTTGLSRFRYVRVRSIAAGGEGHDPHGAGATAGAGYVLDGAVRRSGTAFRVSARLTDVATGEHLWAENYDRDASSALFTLQDDLASRIVATVADGGGVLGRVLVDALRGAEPQSANALFAEWAGYVEHFTPDKHAALRDGLESLVARQPDSATAWAYLSILYGHEIFFDFNPRPDPMPRVRHAAERAVTLDPDNQSAWYALAEAEFFERHRAAFGSAAERAIELNPLHSRTLGGIGVFYAYAGDTGRGAALVARAMSLNPRFPGWFHIVSFLDAYRRGDADGAFTHAARINMPHLPVGGRLFAIAAAGRFGREREARDGIRLVGQSRPELQDAGAARREWSRWIWEGELLDDLVDGYAAALTLVP
jgi:TolB-like protein/Tfp pilus assembly protein PilF